MGQVHFSHRESDRARREVFRLCLGPGQKEVIFGMAPKSVLADIKRDLEFFIGAKIRLKANKGRKKVMEREGVLEQTYPNIFVVKISEGELGERRISYSYTDLLTETVELVVCGHEGRETKFEYQQPAR